MNIETLQNELPDHAKDIKLNLKTLLKADVTSSLDQKQISGIALASAYASKNQDVIAALTTSAAEHLSADEINALKAAAIIMAMNNVYYRFSHSMTDSSFATMPAKLRMNVIANPGIDKQLFEFASLAVSAINGCGKCMNAHAETLLKVGINKEAIQMAVRIASVINAFALARELA